MFFIGRWEGKRAADSWYAKHRNSYGVPGTIIIGEGVCCPACPIEVRDLFATAHNLLVTPRSDHAKFDEKLEELRHSVRMMQEVIDKHFGDAD